MLDVGTIVIGARDVARAEGFWREALGYVRRDDDFDDTWVVLLPASGVGTGPGVAIDLSTAEASLNPRIHLDLYPSEGSDQETEIRRLEEIGAVRVDWDRYPEDPDFVVLADTEGNLFCVIDTSRDD